MNPDLEKLISLQEADLEMARLNNEIASQGLLGLCEDKMLEAMVDSRNCWVG